MVFQGCVIDLVMMYLHTLQQMEVSDAFLLLAPLYLSPFLMMGTTSVAPYLSEFYLSF